MNLRIALLALPLLACRPAGLPTARTEALDQGARLTARGAYEPAEAAFAEALALASTPEERAEVQLAWSSLAARQAHLDQARARLQAAEAEGTPAQAARALLTRARLSPLSERLTLLETLAARFPDEVAAEDGLVERARHLTPSPAPFLTALAAHPHETGAKARYLLGCLAWRAGAMDEARDHLRRFLSEHPDHPDADDVTLTLAALAPPDEAAARLTPLCQARRGLIPFGSERPDLADAACLHLGHLHLAAGRPDLAQSAFALLLKRSPDDALAPEALAGMGQAQRAQGRPEDAHAELRARFPQSRAARDPDLRPALTPRCPEPYDRL